jgi:hypothetical protein
MFYVSYLSLSANIANFLPFIFWPFCYLNTYNVLFVLFVFCLSAFCLCSPIITRASVFLIYFAFTLFCLLLQPKFLVVGLSVSKSLSARLLNYLIVAYLAPRSCLCSVCPVFNCTSVPLFPLVWWRSPWVIMAYPKLSLDVYCLAPTFYLVLYNLCILIIFICIIPGCRLHISLLCRSTK